MKQREILLFDEQLELLKAYHGGDFDYDGEHNEALHDLLSTLSKVFLSDDYYEKYREYNRQLLEETNA